MTARRATEIKRIREEKGENVLLLDAGDQSQGRSFRSRDFDDYSSSLLTLQKEPRGTLCTRVRRLVTLCESWDTTPLL